MTKIIDQMHRALDGPISLHLKVEGGKAWISGLGFDDFVIVPEGCGVAIDFEVGGNYNSPVSLSLTRLPNRLQRLD